MNISKYSIVLKIKVFEKKRDGKKFKKKVKVSKVKVSKVNENSIKELKKK